MTNTMATTIDPSASVMTVLGPIQGDEVGLVLMNEHLACDTSKISQSTLAQRPNGSLGTPITLDKLAAIKADPFVHVENMTLSSVVDATTELQGVPCKTILDVTPVAGGRDYKAAQSLAQTLGVHVIVGTSCSPNKAQTEEELDMPMTAEMKDIEASKQDIEFMERELLHGIDDSSSVCAGFIGEVEMSNQFTPSELRELKAATVVQTLTNAPMIVAERTPSKHALQILDHIQACGGLLNRTILSHMDMYCASSNRDFAFLQKVLDRGAVLSFDRYSVSSASFDPDGTFPSVQQVADCIHSLIQIKADYIHQIVLSSGVFMKLQYQKYGGMGFGVLTGYLLPRLLAKGLTQAQVDIMTIHNPRRILQWWKPPPEPEKQKEYLPCSVCKKLFEPILGEYYTKYTFTYCDTKCLRKHRKMGFKALD